MEIEVKPCTKVKYGSKAFAEMDIFRIKNRINYDHKVLETPLKVPIRAYKCKFCGGWHLTSQEEWGPKDEELEVKDMNFAMKIPEKEQTPEEKIKELESKIQSLEQQVFNRDKMIRSLKKTNNELIIKTLNK